VPGPEPSSLLLGEGPGAGSSVFAAVSHLDVKGNISFVLSFGVPFHNSEVLFIFTGDCLREVAALELCLIEAVEEGERNVFVLLVLEFPIYPLLLRQFVVLQYAEIDVHKIVD